MVTPSADLHEIGAMMFAVVPGWGVMLLFSGDFTAFLIGVSLLAGVAANASLFTRLPIWVRIVAIAAPWITYATYLFSGLLPPNTQRAFALPFFFPWAIGLALINVAQIRKDVARRSGLTIASSDRGVSSSVGQGGSR
jgi:hypothetical protein